MRTKLLFLALMLTALLATGCARPWTNPNIQDEKLSGYQFDKDSTDCSVQASEQYPLDKDRQLPIYEACMEKRGWEKNKTGFFQ
ncbi:hypothetical protein [Pseudodesulfovibrio sp. zrk46]|uniref:hypothetical protein n=1 Tax=Pseudodesulfovibrio sp. zrk46 TaxID=2725288 RepID=UPI0014490559|nr:hypothetical protein [Pseudodesulfovibrio sp. zrk46]QJB56465.1 hypothetical protein HFN16_08600 [Pseudodesulfovibrio sp. zrk46]